MERLAQTCKFAEWEDNHSLMVLPSDDKLGAICFEFVEISRDI